MSAQDAADARRYRTLCELIEERTNVFGDQYYVFCLEAPHERTLDDILDEIYEQEQERIAEEESER